MCTKGTRSASHTTSSFEWALLNALFDAGDKWLEAIRDFGEPPAIARVVELLSQWEYVVHSDPNRWAATLQTVAKSSMRSQWARAWLLGPIASSSFETDDERFFAAVSADDYRLLQKALVWFQAEKTVPNSNILATTSYSTDERIRLADRLGWPSDIVEWRRLITFLLKRRATIPVRLYPDVLAVFEVWQNGLSTFRNNVSIAVLRVADQWLRGIDTPPNDKLAPSPWKPIKGLGDFRQSLSMLVLKSAIAFPEFAEALLKRAIAEENLDDKAFKQILDYSPHLALSHPQLLSEVTWKEIKEELPDEQVAREEAERKAAATYRERLRAKPKSELTKQEKHALSGGFIGRLSLRQ